MPSYQSVSGGGVVVGVGVNTTLATIAAASLPPGYYEVEVTVSLQTLGAVVPLAVDLSNVRLVIGARAAVPLIADENPIVKSAKYNLTGAEALTVQSIAAGTAGLAYSASITATRIS